MKVVKRKIKTKMDFQINVEIKCRNMEVKRWLMFLIGKGHKCELSTKHFQLKCTIELLMNHHLPVKFFICNTYESILLTF